MKVTYKTVGDCIKQRLPFTNNQGNFRGEFEGGVCGCGCDVLSNKYVIYSYSTIIAVYNYIEGRWWVTNEKYSKTTSRPLNKVQHLC